MDFGPVQIAIVLVIGLLVFGPKRLPELGRSLGGGLKEFKDSITGKETDSQPVTPQPQGPSDDARSTSEALGAKVQAENG
jgi:sec-independent protein translocase protein TatA